MTYLLIGIIAGIAAGMFGIGGGVIMVPALILVAGLSITQANGTSLAALMMPVGIFAVLAYRKNHLVDFKVAAAFAIGLLIGVYFGARFALWLPADNLKQLYGLFLLWVSWRFLDIPAYYRKRKGLPPAIKPSDTENSLHFIFLLIIGIFAGILSGMFGIGGGLVLVPLMVTFLNFNPKKAIGTSLAALLLPVALPGVIAYYNAGQINLEFAGLLALGLIAGSIIGAKITISMPSPIIKKVYAVFLIIMGFNFIFF